MNFKYTPVYFHDIDMSDQDYQTLKRSVDILSGEADPSRWSPHIKKIATLMIEADITGPLKEPSDQGPDRYRENADLYAEKCRLMLYGKTAFSRLDNEQRDLIVTTIAQLFEDQCWLHEAGRSKPMGRPLINQDVFEERLDYLALSEKSDLQKLYVQERMQRLTMMFVDIPPRSAQTDFSRIAARDSNGLTLLRLHISAYKENRPKDSILTLPDFMPEALYREYSRQYALRYG